MNWAAIKPALKAIIVSATGLSAAGAVEWQGDSKADGFRPYPRVYLSRSAMAGVGVDSERWELDEYGNVTVNIGGQRQCTLSVRIESDDQDGGTALTVSDRLRMRLRRKSVLAALSQIGFSLNAIQSVTAFTGFTKDSREVSVVNVDVLLNAVDVDQDDTEFTDDYFEAVHVQSDPLYKHDSENDDEDELAHVQINEEISRYA